jgi:ABC-2 type transport system ATP-binding protein
MPKSTSADPPIEVSGLGKSFGEVLALSGVDMVVTSGSLTALLGPNGAGKTTLVRILATLARPDAGTARVLGFDVTRQPEQVRSNIAVTGQFAGLDEALTGTDNMLLIGRLAGLGHRQARHQAADLAALFGLAEAAGRPVRTYSGGMRRRLDVAASLMTRPAVLILDEPTTGLDPASRDLLWSVLRELRMAGTTMLLTTQYLEEADRFADMVHVLSRGCLIASGTPAQLKSQAGRRFAEITLASADAEAAAAATEVLTRQLSLPAVAIRSTEPGRITVPADDGVGTMLAAGAALRAAQIEIADLGIRQPTLDEAFLALTGSGTQDATR